MRAIKCVRTCLYVYVHVCTYIVNVVEICEEMMAEIKYCTTFEKLFEKKICRSALGWLRMRYTRAFVC